MMSPMRKIKRTEKSKEDEIPASKRIKIWGTTKEDLETTWISMRKDRNAFSELVYENVFFNGKIAYIQKDSRRLLHYLGSSIEAIEDIKTRLEPLDQTIQPLSQLRSLPPTMKENWGSFGNYECLPPGLSETLRTAFEEDMNDTAGKTALRDLLTNIVQCLNLDQCLSVVSTGSVRRMSRLATCISTKITTEPSSDSSSDCQEPKEVEDCTHQLPSTDTVHAACNSSLSRGFTKPKLCTADVVVYSCPVGKTGPIRAHLVVSIEKGQTVNQVDIVNGLLSRLPYQYQFGTIYGLLINSCTAKFYSVEYDAKDVDPLVRVHVYEDHCFRSQNSHFDTDAFLDVMVCISLILKSQSDIMNH